MRPTRRPIPIFASYSHADIQLVQDLFVRLRPQLQTSKRFAFSEWRDVAILPGAPWRAEIEAALASCVLGMLFVSSEFLASGFVVDRELPVLLGGKVVVSVLLRPVDWSSQVSWGVEDRQSFGVPVGRDLRSYSACDEAGRDDFAHRLCGQLCAQVDASDPLASPVQPGSVEYLLLALAAHRPPQPGEGPRAAWMSAPSWAHRTLVQLLSAPNFDVDAVVHAFELDRFAAATLADLRTTVETRTWPPKVDRLWVNAARDDRGWNVSWLYGQRPAERQAAEERTCSISSGSARAEEQLTPTTKDATIEFAVGFGGGLCVSIRGGARSEILGAAARVWNGFRAWRRQALPPPEDRGGDGPERELMHLEISA